jgi:nucleoside 2-deoxyribosyltransferase
MTAYYGKGNPVLAQFGYALGLRKPATAATNVKAQAKAQLTRALRYTMGPRQKAAIRADAPSTVTVSSDGTVQAAPAPSE